MLSAFELHVKSLHFSFLFVVVVVVVESLQTVQWHRAHEDAVHQLVTAATTTTTTTMMMCHSQRRDGFRGCDKRHVRRTVTGLDSTLTSLPRSDQPVKRDSAVQVFTSASASTTRFSPVNDDRRPRNSVRVAEMASRRYRRGTFSLADSSFSANGDLLCLS